LVTESDVPERS